MSSSINEILRNRRPFRIVMRLIRRVKHIISTFQSIRPLASGVIEGTNVGHLRRSSKVDKIRGMLIVVSNVVPSSQEEGRHSHLAFQPNDVKVCRRLIV